MAGLDSEYQQYINISHDIRTSVAEESLHSPYLFDMKDMCTRQNVISGSFNIISDI